MSRVPNRSLSTSRPTRSLTPRRPNTEPRPGALPRGERTARKARRARFWIIFFFFFFIFSGDHDRATTCRCSGAPPSPGHFGILGDGERGVDGRSLDESSQNFPGFAFRARRRWWCAVCRRSLSPDNFFWCRLVPRCAPECRDLSYRSGDRRADSFAASAARACISRPGTPASVASVTVRGHLHRDRADLVP